MMVKNDVAVQQNNQCILNQIDFMKKVLMIFFVIAALYSCKNDAPKKTPLYPVRQSPDKAVTNAPKKIGYYMSGDKVYAWCAKHRDPDVYYPRIIFQEEFAIYQLHGQCYYWFFTYYYHTGTDKIELLWSYKNDCRFEPKSWQGSNGIKKYPKSGDAFCDYSLVNDSVIKVKYNFPEWANKVNEMEKDSIFPAYLYLVKK